MNSSFTYAGVPRESNGGVPVNVQDQHSKMLDLDFIRSLGATTLAANAEPNDRTITLTDATGFSAGDVIGVFSAGTGLFYFGEQIGASAGNVITLDTLMDRQHLAGSNVIRATRNLASIAGSAGSPIIYQIGPIGAILEIDITRITGYIQDATAMDDAMFGGLGAPLTYGISLRHNNGVIDNIWNAKTNGRLALVSASDLNYTEKAPSGSNGLRFRNTYAGQEKHGVTVRLMPSDTLELLVQDAAITGLEIFNLMAQGHVVTD